MNISEDIKPVTSLKFRTAELLNQINKTHRPVIITQNEKLRAVLQDPQSFDKMHNAIGLLKLIAQGEEDIRQGNYKTQKQVFDNIEKSLLDFTRERKTYPGTKSSWLFSIS